MNERNSLQRVDNGSTEEPRRDEAQAYITYIGHATLLLRFGEVSVLTDPNFDDKLGYFLPRVTAPGIRMSELPRIDAVLLTHAHADHLSFRSLRALPPEIPVYAPRALAQWLKREGISTVHSVEPGEEFSIAHLSVTAGIARHIGARYGIDRWRGTAHMYLLDDRTTSVLFTGDTAITPDAISLVRKILPRRVDIALLPIGFAPWWKKYFFRRGHLTAADALSLFEQLNARILIPFHWGTFRHLTSGAFDAIQILRSLLTSYEKSSQVKILPPGATFTVTDSTL